MSIWTESEGGGGAGFTLGPETNTFVAATQAAAITARNTYATNNASWLAAYDADPSLLVRLQWPTAPTNEAYYRRDNSAWVAVSMILPFKGDKGDEGDPGPAGTGVPAVSASDNSSLLQVVSGAWAKVTGIAASLITSGTLALDRIPSIPLAKAASDLVARLVPTGGSDTTYLRGDGSWATPPSGGGGGVDNPRGAGTGLSLSGNDLEVDDPILPWTSGDTYAVGDTVKYNGILYVCRVANSETAFTPSHWRDTTLAPVSGNAIGVSVSNHEATIAVESGGIGTDELADDGVTPAKLDAGTDAKKLAMRTRIAAAAQSALNDYVTKLALEGHENDLYASFQAASAMLGPGSNYLVGAFCIATNTSGAPTATDTQNQQSVSSGDATIVLGRLRSDSDPNNFVEGPALAASDYPSGTVRHLSIPAHPSTHLTVTWTGNSTLVGTGDAAYLWAPVTVAIEAGESAPADSTNENDYWRISEIEPSQLDIHLPFNVIDGAPWVDSDGENWSADDRLLFLAKLVNYTQGSSTGDPWENAIAAAFLRYIAANPQRTDYNNLLTGLTNALLAYSSFVSGAKDKLLPEVEHEVLTGMRWRGAYNSDNPPVNQQNKDIGESNANQLWFRLSSSTDSTLVGRYAKADHVVEIWKDASNYRVYIVESDSFTLSGSDRYINTVEGATVAVGTIAANDAVQVRLYGPFVTNDRVRRDVRASGSATDVAIPTEKAVRDAINAHAALPKASSLFDSSAVTIGSSEETIATLAHTPSSTAAKLKVEFNATMQGDRAGDPITDSYMSIKVKRGTNTIRTETREWLTHVASDNKVTAQAVVFLIDTPNADTSQTYTVTVTRGAQAENTTCFDRSLIITEVS